MNDIKAICYGDVLMDILPDGPRVGGAPLNVAINLKKFGIESAIISRVGKDKFGNDLLDFVQKNGLDTSFIQKDDTYPTGIVNVRFENGEPHYEIIENVAWDHIQEPDLPENLNPDFIIYSSLAARGETSRKSLFDFLANHPAKIVFDLNLRESFYQREIILKLFRNADILKFNGHEFEILSEWLKLNRENTDIAIGQMLSLFPKIDAILLTMGAKGATIKTRYEYFHVNAHDVEIKDTIGAGDAFLAAFLSKFNSGDMEYAMNYAAATAGIVASKSGPNPEYTVSEIEKLMNTGS